MLTLEQVFTYTFVLKRGKEKEKTLRSSIKTTETNRMTVRKDGGLNELEMRFESLHGVSR